jgi:uncharacterized membrane protein
MMMMMMVVVLVVVMVMVMAMLLCVLGAKATRIFDYAKRNRSTGSWAQSRKAV